MSDGIATRLQGREDVAQGTAAFHFARPAGFSFKPGQALDLILDSTAAGGEQAARHAFSIASAPWENRLTIATRLRDSAFKRQLAALPTGGAAALDGPFGSLTLHGDRSRPALLIAGGIGITPYRSMLRQAARDAEPRRLVLLYSNRRPEDAAFLAELRELERTLPQFTLRPVMTATGNAGRIDAAMLRGVLADLRHPVCYATGSTAMVSAVMKLLNEAGVLDDDIRSEAFAGY